MRALAAALLVAGCGRAKMTERSWEGQFCSIAAPSSRIVEDRRAWEALWREAFDREAPPADFAKDFAVAVFLGARPTGGWSVEFFEDGGRVRWRERGPGDSFAAQAFTQPYAIRLFPREP